MLDENEICEEVVALIDRMDKFPEEFIDDGRLTRRWGLVMDHINQDHDNPVFTAAELRVLREKVQGLARLRMKKEILQNIMYGGEPDNGAYGMAQESSSYYGVPLTPVGIANSSIGSTHAVLTSNATGSSFRVDSNISDSQKKELLQLLEEYDKQKEAEAEALAQSKKAKPIKKAAY
jgi:hypothetical protein